MATGHSHSVAKEFMTPSGQVDWERYRDMIYLVNGCGWERKYSMNTDQTKFVHKNVHGEHSFEEAIVIQQSLDALKEEQ